ncbi:PepSY domain-containing protein [Roseibium sp. RKSG952]|uniref:PepSY domain-containing protein n=1 Tax=Roseibium sp. RKSG952 TaxID=2529384 RepID=UPI0012BD1FD5|nr:PepSY domain-containing protein [Roseibium sp. RKSG952]MTH99456.1 PepSY domain-containing protein [Roseibium sp. RKSG952]
MGLFRRTLPVVVFGATIGLSSAGAAQAEVMMGDRLGTSVGEIATALEAQGYMIHEIDVSTRRIEVEATLNNRKLEIDVDPKTGNVIKVEDD